MRAPERTAITAFGGSFSAIKLIRLAANGGAFPPEEQEQRKNFREEYSIMNRSRLDEQLGDLFRRDDAIEVSRYQVARRKSSSRPGLPANSVGG